MAVICSIIFGGYTERNIVGKCSLLHTVFWPLPGHRRTGLRPVIPPSQEIKSPHTQPSVGLSLFVGISFPVARPMCSLLFLLKFVSHMAPGQPSCFICPPWVRDWIFPSWLEKGLHVGKWPCIGCWDRNTHWMGDQSPLLKLILLCFFCM